MSMMGYRAQRKPYDGYYNTPVPHRMLIAVIFASIPSMILRVYIGLFRSILGLGHCMSCTLKADRPLVDADWLLLVKLLVKW
ncbi:hypothetical protein BDQ12DRAFT_690993 [Crucibulum laeve]|uniref:Uncharacterized protein n=1 Tax=Crucibulum laeve TaxID=68775 RepID=A0A5C3LKB9_9AGAR|nr:hypothetical protein BDQ12DRAFT_690993 [Crucibulum laeve]